MEDPTKSEQKQTRRGRFVAGALAVGAVLLEPELLPGIAIGLAVAVAPKLGPRVAGYLRPAAQKAQSMAGSALARGRELGQKLKARVMPTPPGVAAPSRYQGAGR